MSSSISSLQPSHKSSMREPTGLKSTSKHEMTEKDDHKRSPSQQQQTVKLSFSGFVETKFRAEKTSLTLESESELNLDEDMGNGTGSHENNSVEEYESACYFLKIVPSKIVIKSLPLSSISLSNYGINHTTVHALIFALKVGIDKIT